jgi:hypothetical protein
MLKDCKRVVEAPILHAMSALAHRLVSSSEMPLNTLRSEHSPLVRCERHALRVLYNLHSKLCLSVLITKDYKGDILFVLRRA